MFSIIGIVILFVMVFGGFAITGGALGPVFEAIPHDSSAGLSEQERALILELGAYVGETFIRNHGGLWGWAETLDAGRNVGLRTNDGLIVFPVSTASNRLEGADVDSMVIFYRILTVWPQAQGGAKGLSN